MKKVQCKEGLDIYKKFLTRMTRISEFLKVAEVSVVAGLTWQYFQKGPNYVGYPLSLFSVVLASGNWSRGHPRSFSGKPRWECFFSDLNFCYYFSSHPFLALLNWPNLIPKYNPTHTAWKYVRVWNASKINLLKKMPYRDVLWNKGWN